MSRPTPLSGRALRAAACAALALATALIAALTLSPRSDAAFTTSECQGADITGRGASFARDAHGAFAPHFQAFYCPGGPAVDYEALGSGAGRRVVGERTGTNADGSQSRNQIPRFGMTDEPPTPTGISQMDDGTDATGDEDLIHVIPAAVGAVAPIVNFPNNCDVGLLPTAERTDEQGTGDGIPDGTVRVRFTKTKFDKAWAKDSDADSWIELFPELAPDLDCDVPIIRVARFDDSGTSFAFKDYLDNVNQSRNWIPDFTTNPDTRNWPNAAVGARADCGGATGPGGGATDATDQLTSGCSNGNGSLVSKLISTDGSIGYTDVSTARTASPSLAITPRSTAMSPYDNDTYWTQIQNGSNEFTEPTFSANGFRTDGSKGSNCQSTTFTGVPTAAQGGTLGDWSNASGVNSPQGYGICSLTYGLVFDDYANAYALQPDQAAEEQKARTVKDYWSDIVSSGGQGVLFGQDYSPLPSGILSLAQDGVTDVGWDKTAGGGGGGGGGTPGGGTPGGGGGGTTPPPPAATPSNRFSATRTTINTRRGTATISVRVPGRGTIQAVATAPNRLIRAAFRVGGTRLGVSRAGTYRLTIRPGRTAKRILNRRGKLRTSVRLSYRPTGGTTRSTTRAVTLKLRKRARGR